MRLLLLTTLVTFLAWPGAPACPSLAASPAAVAPPTAQPKRSTAASSNQADKLYHRVWELVRDQFYDSTFNNQDWERWEHRYDGKLKTMDDANKAAETMLASLGDRYTRFLNKEAFDDEKMQIAAHLFGIGVQIGMDKTQKIIVIAPIENTPAARAGLRPSDEIELIDGKPTKGLSVEQASKRIRGPINTQVVIGIMRNKERKQFRITRAEIPLKSVQIAKMLNSDIGYIRLSTFISQVANQEMNEALTRLSPARGLILDLRQNSGGLVTNAIDITSMFLDGGNVVSTVDRNGRTSHAMCHSKPISHQPLVLLIDQGSASAAEILSGALRDHLRAELVGQKTFGKGLVQGINRLEDGSGVNITIARYLTPDGIDINKKGIVPDHAVELKEKEYKEAKGPWWLDPGGPTVKRSPEDLKDVQLKKAVEVLEGKIQRLASPYDLKLNLKWTFPDSTDRAQGSGLP